MAPIQDSTWNSALLKLSHKFTDDGMVQSLGLQVLKLLPHEVDTALNKHKPAATLAAYDLLKKFALKYESRQKAQKDLQDGLRKVDLNHLARLFEQWVEEQGDQASLTQESTYKIYFNT